MTQGQGLPDSDRLASLLLDAAAAAAELQHDYYEAWRTAKIARFNRDLIYDEVVAAAYADGGVDGKNAEQRAAQLAAIIGGNQRLQSHDESLRHTESEVKRIEGLLEAARTYRSALHDMVALRVAELGSDARAEGKMVTALDCINSVLRMATRAVGREALIEKGTNWHDLKA